MANYQQILDVINQNIKQNGNEEITGNIMNNVLKLLLEFINGQTKGYNGVLTTETRPNNQTSGYWFALEGVYSSFGISVPENNLGIVYWKNNKYVVDLIDLVDEEAIKEYIDQQLININLGFGGEITDLNQSPTIEGMYIPKLIGVYPNFNNLNKLETDGFVMFLFKDGVFSKINIPLDINIEDEVKNNSLDAVNGKAVEKYAVKKVNTIVDLRNTNGEYEGQIITLLGYYKSGDKEPLNYKWTNEQRIDDGGSVINSSSGSWLAIFNDNVINILHFGLKDNYDNTDVFFNADKFKNIYVPKLENVYILNESMSLTANYYGENSNVLFNNYNNVLTNLPIKLINKTKSDISFNGTGINDLEINGEYDLINGAKIIIQIKDKNVSSIPDNIITDTFKYSLDNGVNWTVDNLTIDPSDDSETLLPLYCKDKNWPIGYSGLKINFINNTGHDINDKWELDTFQKNNEFNFNGFLKENGEVLLSVQESGGLIIGKNSGSGTNISAGSTIVGSNSFQKNITGYSNIGIGNYVLQNNIKGALNVAIGDYALHRNITGQDNVAIGVYTMFDNVSGYGNVGCGQDALRYNNSGNLNTAIGVQSLYFNNSIGNTGVGNSSVRGNINGFANTGVGKSALLINKNGNANTSIGAESSYNLDGGNNNTSVGESSGFRLTTGNNNTFIGRSSGVNILQKKDVTNSVSLGCDSYTDKDNQVVIGDDNIVEIITRGGNTNLGSIDNLFNVVFSKLLILKNLAVFENNTDAINGGVSTGGVYRNSNGDLKIRF